MAQTFKETAHLNVDPEKYRENHKAIFGEPAKKSEDDQKRVECSNCGRAFYSRIPVHLSRIGCAFCGEFIEVGS